MPARPDRGHFDAVVDGGRDLAPGQPFRPRFDPAKLMLFAPSGARLR